MIYKQRTAAHRTGRRAPKVVTWVVALRKSDLYSSLWKGAYELRGGMDASQYKDYVLTLLFVKYVTDKSKSDKNSLTDLPSGGSFDNLVTFKGDKEIGDKTNKAISKLTEGADERAWRGEIKRLRATVDPGQITEEVIDYLV
jgi:type I restriction-modification system DNA methylase subunit